MFQHARLKLTAWYLLIIMAISLLFSVAIYARVNLEFIRFEKTETRIQKEIKEGRIHPFPGFPGSRFESGMAVNARTRLALALVAINLAIFGLAGTAGYFLAGKTLKPIEEMVDAQNRFITDASHEMRTPLTSLRSEIEVALRDKKINLEQARKILASNLEEVISLQALSDNLLELSQKGKPQNVSMVDVSINDAIDQAIKKLNGSIAAKKITVEQKVQNTTVSGIPERIIELFVILLDNAIKYSPVKSKVSITAKRIDSKVRIEIKDNGIGIAKEDVSHVFDRFWRSDKSRSKTSGYGLGLAIAKEIVEFHKGSIEITSTPGNGTTAIVEI